MGLSLNTPQVKNYTGLNPVRSGSTAESDNNVKFVPQELTEEQQAQARQNIGAAAAGSGGEQIQSDWAQTDITAVDYIKHKPSIPAAQIQSDWNQSDTTALDYIKNKPTIPSDTLAREYESKNSIIYLSGDSTYTYQGNGTFEGAYTRNGWTSKNSSNEVNLTMGKNLLVSSSGGGENQVGELSNKGLDVAIVQPYWSTGQNLVGTYTGKLTVLCAVNEVTSRYEPWWASAFDMSDYSNLTTVWCANTLLGYMYDDHGMCGTYIYVDKPFTTEGSGMSIPITTNLVAVYVPRNRKQEYITAITRIYSETADLTPITDKIVEYDFLNWIDDHTPQPIILPTLPLTMTDINGNTIAGDFVAQNITITPAV